VRPQGQQGFYQDAAPAEVPLPQPVPTYYPGALGLSQAQPLTVARGQTLSGVDIILIEGTPSLVTGTIVRADGGEVAAGSVTSRAVGTDSIGGFDFGGGTGVQQGGAFKLTLPPGEYVLEANVQSTMGPTRPSPDDQMSGTVRITVGGAAVEAVTIVVGKGATASGRIVFEGSTPAPASPPAPTGAPLFNPDGPGCRSGLATIAADWTFKVEGLLGTCGASPQPMFGRWTVKAVTFRGQNIMDQLVTFESGQHYNDVQIVVTDKRTQVDLVVAGDDGQPTREYVAIAFPVDKTKWTMQSRRVRIYTPSMQMNPAFVMPPGSPGGVTGAGPAGAGANPARFQGLAAGEYFLVAVDDIGTEEWQDPAVLERLSANATRITVTDEAPIEVPLRRVTLAEVMR
jgi:hypothetical protein